MAKIRIHGGVGLHGRIPIAGAKNSALKLMAASLLTEEPLKLSHVPYLADITTMAQLLLQHGVDAQMDDTNAPNERDVTLRAQSITSLTAPYDLVRTMRAAVQVLGPLLTRFHKARVSLPGGCAIGTRPIDMHLHALELMGAEIELDGGYVVASAPQGLHGAVIQFDKVSVGATENALTAATLAKGRTVIHNAAREPEVTDLAHMLVKMGANISGIGSDTLIIEGVEKLSGTSHRVMADRIETGTYLCAVAVAGGDVELVGAVYETSAALIEKLIEMGVDIEQTEHGLRVRRELSKPLIGCDIITQPYPAFPTDMQAQVMAVMAVAGGSSSITETIFENRYMHVPELTRMGANITVRDRTALVRGVDHLTGAEVMATDLRASVSLVIAALVAQGETTINRVYHLDRGYERLEEKLSACGAEVERVK